MDPRPTVDTDSKLIDFSRVTSIAGCFGFDRSLRKILEIGRHMSAVVDVDVTVTVTVTDWY